MKELYVVIPGVIIGTLGYLTNRFCDRLTCDGFPCPPSWVFGTVWPVLYLLIGISWYRAAPHHAALYWGLIFLLGAWLVLYPCLRAIRMAAADLVLSVSVAVYLIYRLMMQQDQGSAFLLMPLVAWLSFATYLNVRSMMRLGF